jgi:hypothetical protein
MLLGDADRRLTGTLYGKGQILAPAEAIGNRRCCCVRFVEAAQSCRG